MLVAIMVHSGENLGSNPKVGERQRGGEILPPTGNNAERESARPSAELFAEAGGRAARRDLTGEIMGDPPPKQIKEAIDRADWPPAGLHCRQSTLSRRKWILWAATKQSDLVPFITNGYLRPRPSHLLVRKARTSLERGRSERAKFVATASFTS